MKHTRITSVIPSSLTVREAENGGRTLEGYALKFGVRSVLLGYSYPFYEVLEPGCVTDDMLREQRIYFTMFHDRQSILGRWDKGHGSLRLSVDEVGLKVECEMPMTPDGNKALELVRRGDLTEMSFAYWTDESEGAGCVRYAESGETTDGGQKIVVRHVDHILEMYDVTVAASPAYPDTEIEAREQLVREAVERQEEPAEEPQEEPEAEPQQSEDSEADELAEAAERESVLRMRMERQRAFRTALDI